MIAEVTYVPKAKNLGELEAKAAQLSWKPVLMGLGLTLTVGILLGGSIGMSFLTGALEGVTYGLILSGGGMALVGLGWLVLAAAISKKNKMSAAKFATVVLASGLVCGGIGAALYVTSDFHTGPSGPGSDAPKAKAGAAGKAAPAQVRKGPRGQ